MITIKQIIPAQGIVANFTYTADSGDDTLKYFGYATPVACWAIVDSPGEFVTSPRREYVTALLAHADSTELLPIDDMPKSYTFQGYSSK